MLKAHRKILSDFLLGEGCWFYVRTFADANEDSSNLPPNFIQGMLPVLTKVITLATMSGMWICNRSIKNGDVKVSS